MPADMSPGGPSSLAGGPALLLSGARLSDGRSVDVRIAGDRIEAVGPAGTLSAPERMDLTGYLILPAPVEPHAHLDEAFSGTPVPGTGPAVRPGPEDGPGGEQQMEELQRRITEAALTGLGYGATVQRTHVRIGGSHGLTAVSAALQAARALHGLLELQVVPLPGPLTGIAGANERALLREALGMGAHAVGGRPDLDSDPDGHLDTVVALAEKTGCPLDVHTDAADPRRLTRLADALGALPVSATIGPCAGLGSLPRAVAVRCAEQLAAAGVVVVSLPQCPRCVGTVSPGAASSGGDGRRGQQTPIRLLLAAGVRVAAGSGALRDTANPVGRVDPLEAAFLLTACGELGEAAAYEAVSGTARAALGLSPVRVAPGFPAEVLAVRGDSLRGVLSGGHSRVVVHGGRIVSRTSAVREFAETTAPAVPRQGRGEPLCPD
jgi:cytosine deaminase